MSVETERVSITVVLDVRQGAAYSMIRRAVADAVSDLLSPGERIVRVDIEAS